MSRLEEDPFSSSSECKDIAAKTSLYRVNSRSSYNDRPSEVFISRDSGTVISNKPPLPPEEDGHRAVHRIRLSALQHNFTCVEAAANRQQCSVITVVKADGYGHGAIATALYLADVCGADAFAVATLEEGVALRKAFEQNQPGRWSKQQLATTFLTPEASATVTTAVTAPLTTTSSAVSPILQDAATFEATARIMRPTQIRILVLGPPVGFPRCFDDYYHHNIEVMVSGPEVAAALSEWVADENERKRTQVERTATELKAKALCHPSLPRDFSLSNTMEEKTMEVQTPPLSSESVTIQQAIDESSALVVAASLPGIPRFQSSTLGNVSGQDLAREVRALLIKKASDDAIQQQILQQQQVQSQKQLQLQSQQQQPLTEPLSTVNSSCESSVSSDPKVVNHNAYKISPCASSSNVFRLSKPSGQVFAGIEQVARKSLNREAANKDAIENVIPSSNTNPAGIRRVLRWHALVDSGMGRLGFRTDPVQDGEDRRDTVDVIRQLVDCEIHYNAPIEFYGMCTHMADACSTSDYTHEQVAKFISLLKRVRDVNIFIPTVSTDNSAALLTSNLTHFDPNEILSQEHSNTRGYVRTGGAIYGQRPAFSQLRSVSTLLASVRHVAILRKGESVGYDRAYTAPYDVRIATLTVGFADGYPRELGNGIGKVAIRGSVFPVAGNVCMDMMMVELGPVDDLAGAGASVAVRDTAVLWGPMDEEEEDGLVRLQDLAVTLNTTQSALTCGLDKMRVRRQFV